MNWDRFLAEGEKAVRIVREGLRKRNINAGEPIFTKFNTDIEELEIITPSGSKTITVQPPNRRR